MDEYWHFAQKNFFFAICFLLRLTSNDFIVTDQAFII